MSKTAGAGAPEIKPSDLPETALLEAAHRLDLYAGGCTSPADYAEGAAVLFSELRKLGWKVIVPS